MRYRDGQSMNSYSEFKGDLARGCLGILLGLAITFFLFVSGCILIVSRG